MKNILMASLLAALAGAAHAQSTPYYVGGALGVSYTDVDCSAATKCDKTDGNFKLIAGYRFNPAWAVEVGYMGFGNQKSTDASGDTKIQTTAAFAALATRMNIMPALDGVLRLGLARVRSEATVSPNVGDRYKETEIRMKPYLGLGLEYTVLPELRATLGADFTQAEVTPTTTGSVRALNVGVQYGF